MEHNVGLNYGAYPNKIAKQLKISVEAATLIFNRYHNELYKGITLFREDYVLPTVEEEGRIHLGLGCYMYSDNPSKHIRTLFNACSQFWSIITLLTINKMHQLIDEKGLSEQVKIITTIYDSIYFIVKDNARIVKWVNDTVIPIITKDFIKDQIVPNEAEAEIGYNWYDLHKIKNNANIVDISRTLNTIRIERIKYA